MTRALASLLAVLVILLASCDRSDYRDLDSLKELGEMEYGRKDVDSKELEKLRADILEVKEEIRSLKSNQGRLASFYNALGEEYRRLGMFAPALEAYQESLAITGGNHAVLYKAGLMASQLYQLEVDPDKAGTWLAMAEKYYENAIRLGDDYEDALYALAVIRLFERQDLPGAKNLVQRALVKYPNFVSALFLAGRIAVEEGNVAKAREYYETIEDVAQDETDKINARANLEELKLR